MWPNLILEIVLPDDLYDHHHVIEGAMSVGRNHRDSVFDGKVCELARDALWIRNVIKGIEPALGVKS